MAETKRRNSPAGLPKKPAAEWLTATRRSVVLRKATVETQGYLWSALKPQKLEAGQVLYTRSSAPETFYVVQSGLFSATLLGSDGTTEQAVQSFGPSDAIGSASLLQGMSAREETVTCLEAGTVWTLPKKVFDAKLKLAPAPPQKLVERLRRVPFFSGLSQGELVLLSRAFSEVKLDKGQILHAQGADADALLSLEEGQLKLVEDEDEASKTILKAPVSFGKNAFFHDERANLHQAEARAWAGPATLLRFGVTDIFGLLGYGLQQRALRELHMSLLRGVQIAGVGILDSLDDPEADANWLGSIIITEPRVKPGELVVKEGANDDRLYIVRRGVASVRTNELGEAGTLGVGQYFGELSLTGKKHKRSASILAAEGADGAGGGESLHLLSVPAAIIKTNPRLAPWMEKLNGLAEAAARDQMESSEYKSAYAHGTRKVAGAASSTTTTTTNNNNNAGTGAGGAGAVYVSPEGKGGGRKGSVDGPPLLLKRISFAEQLVVDQRNRANAQKKADKAKAAAAAKQPPSGATSHRAGSSKIPKPSLLKPGGSRKGQPQQQQQQEKAVVLAIPANKGSSKLVKSAKAPAVATILAAAAPATDPAPAVAGAVPAPAAVAVSAPAAAAVPAPAAAAVPAPTAVELAVPTAAHETSATPEEEEQVQMKAPRQSAVMRMLSRGRRTPSGKKQRPSKEAPETPTRDVTLAIEDDEGDEFGMPRLSYDASGGGTTPPPPTPSRGVIGGGGGGGFFARLSRVTGFSALSTNIAARMSSASRGAATHRRSQSARSSWSRRTSGGSPSVRTTSPDASPEKSPEERRSLTAPIRRPLRDYMA